ncbi:MAG TPA: hypothetical protein VM910_13485 [Bradyrhizobium sp.]|nr:hypothetical protein [Bradyrhizobium sp.]
MRVDRVSLPVIDIAAGKCRAGALRAQRITRRMARAAMRETLDQIGAAIPFRALRRIGPIGPAMKKQQLPARDHKALIEWKGKLVLALWCTNGLACHQIGVERVVVLIADMREVIVGECRIEMPAFPIDAHAHGTAEGLFRPPPYAGLRIRRDVGRIDGAERRRHWNAAREVLSTH